MKEFKIAEKPIGCRSPVYVIAEAGINHNGSEERALRMIDAAADCGADAIKFQSFRAEQLVSPAAAAPRHVGESSSKSLLDFFESVELSPGTTRRLKQHADSIGLTFLSTPFDERSADLLEELGVPAYKIASSDLTHFPLLAHVGRKGKPLLLSTGMSYLEEVRHAVRFLSENGNPPLGLMHCVSTYPAPHDELNLRAIRRLEETFGVPVGFSDHSGDPLYALGAVAAGAVFLEKHFTVDRHLPGPDQKLSIEPEELKRTLGKIRLLEAALGTGEKQPAPSEMTNREISRRSIFVNRAVEAGNEIERSMLCVRRPGHGIPPTQLEALIGKRLLHRVNPGQALYWSDLIEGVS